MRFIPLIEVIIVNAVLIPLLLLITQNYALRDAYWLPEGFTPTTVRYPFFFITSAVNGSTRISGLLSVDWQQVVLVVIILIDLAYVYSAVRSRRRSRLQ